MTQGAPRARKPPGPPAQMPGATAPDLLSVIRKTRAKSTIDPRFSLSDLALFASGMLRGAYAVDELDEIKYWADYLRKINEALAKVPPEANTGFELIFTYLEKPKLPLIPPGTTEAPT
jgi:hypothetical protein